MFKSTHDKKFMKATVQIMMDQLEDLEHWSVWNKDKYNEEIGKIRELLEKIK